MATISQKCPKCQKWCECEETGFTERAKIGFQNVTETGKNIGGFFGKLLGKPGKMVGETLGGIAGGITGSVVGTLGGAALVDSYNFKCPFCGHEWSVYNDIDNKEEDKKKEVEEIINGLIEKWNDCETEDNYQAILKEVEKTLENYKPENTQASQLYELMSCAYYITNNKDKALENVNKSLEINPENPSVLALRGLYKWINSEPEFDTETYSDILKDFSNFYKDGIDINYINADHLKTEFNSLIENYINYFKEIPPFQRKFVFFKDKIDAVADNIKVLPLDKKIPGIFFPASHPRINTLYLLHPLKKDTYLPVNNFEYELFRDQLLEFARIMESLGAKKISYNIIEEKNSTQEGHNNNEYEADVNIKGVQVSGKLDMESDRLQMKKLRNEFESVSTYFDTQNIEMPDLSSLVWYHYNKDWQYKVESRISGRKKQESFLVSTFSEDFLDRYDKKEIELEVKYLLNSGRGKVKTSKEFKFRNQLFQQWRIDVEFYPIRRCFFHKLFSK